ncbi:MAG: hypothetical protein Q4G04_02385, partial [bacterium]|nr:hypothetical protein [bacterium]
IGKHFHGLVTTSGYGIDELPVSPPEHGYIDTSGANAPVLADGMIPIMWDGVKWVKADESNLTTSAYPWYNYTNKLWANAVMVSTNRVSTTRQQYMDADPGTTILEDDIIAYYVWIPRYRYTLFNVGTNTVPEQLINVTFETADTQKSTGSTVGSDLTHPAFTWGAGDNIQELEGIWVGKFETSYVSNHWNPRIKPNRDSYFPVLIYQYYQSANQLDSDTYLTTTGVSQIDVHMMKNTEWGAVAYLKQSAYGLGTTDIALNNYYNSGHYMTGCGYNSSNTTCSGYSSDNGKSSSTTGNITGVYDMAGGNLELVMGVYSSGTTIIYDSYTTASDFSPTLSCTANTYVNCYNNIINLSSDYSARILGDATAETRGWYGDNATFLISNDSFSIFLRGGIAGEDDESISGIFDFFNEFSGMDTFRVSAFVIK